MRSFAIVALLIAVAVACVPKSGERATSEAEVTLCACGAHSVLQASAHVEVFDPKIEGEYLAAHELLSGISTTSTRDALALTNRYVSGIERDVLYGRDSPNGALSVGKRAGRPHGA